MPGLVSAAGNTRTESEKLFATDSDRVVSFGEAVSLSDERLAVGAGSASALGILSAGAVYVFARNGNAWTQEARLIAGDPAPIDLFGSAVSLSGDTLVAGSQNAILSVSDSEVDAFGRPVAISGDTLVVGAPFDNLGIPISAAGLVYVFARDGQTWRQETKLTAGPDASPVDEFGEAVAIRGDAIVVGTRLHDDAGTNAGAAYVFERSGQGGWQRLVKLLPSDGPGLEAGGRGFGAAVAVAGDAVAVGAPLDDDAGDEAGAIYSYVPEPATWLSQTIAVLVVGLALRRRLRP